MSESGEIHQAEIIDIRGNEDKTPSFENDEQEDLKNVEKIIVDDRNEWKKLKKKIEEEHPEYSSITDTLVQFFLKHRRIDPDKKVYAIRRKDGTVAVHTKMPKNGTFIPFSKTTLTYALTYLNFPADSIETDDSVLIRVKDMISPDSGSSHNPQNREGLVNEEAFVSEIAGYEQAQAA